ncbi:MAG: hypothetical protein QOI66_160 [Myxococcales bacterium]|jgi:hypothetical protein|nr:hypothetical protein [Myxococcales bacterium]
MNGRRWTPTAVALAAVLFASAVQACPSCIGKDPMLPPSLKLVGLFLLVPFAIFAVVATVARRLR